MSDAVCWTCGTYYNCRSEEHKHLQQHCHLRPEVLSGDEAERHRREGHDVEETEQAAGG